ncbi:MAG: 3-methylornithyl-N6-L-lysine dehydrogenase PylD [Firmicutes bacterium]|nr:3-methylornithyl-N6-L-lysine dehydrogenase PylD [Bacillota bacterium]
MTRLTTEWIHNMKNELPEWAKNLEEMSNMSLLNLASVAGDVSRGRVNSASWRIKVAVVPVTQGEGIIETFCEQVAAIVEYMGFEVFVTEQTDVWGIYEATQKGAGIIFLADDMYFLALNMSKNVVVENSDATARGFVASLAGAAGGLRDKKVLVLGGGRVGKSALAFLRCRGAEGVVFDTDVEVSKALAADGWKVIRSKDEIKNYDLIVDCTPEGNWITPEMLHPEVLFASPGVPLSMTPEAQEKYSDRIIHDLLQLGVITMLVMAC